MGEVRGSACGDDVFVLNENLTHRHKKMKLNPEFLIGLNYEDYLERGIEGGELVEYSIFSNHSLPEGQGSALIIGWEESTIHAWNHENQHVSFIRSVFERLDPLLDLDFFEGDSSGNSDINIHRSWYNSYYDEFDLLNNDPSPSPAQGAGGGTAHFDVDHIDISWKDYYGDDPFTEYERLTIVHEIGHALGLIDLAFDPKWDRHDSIMSYNDPEGVDYNTWFTDADIAAMQSIWGVENDHLVNNVHRFYNVNDGVHFFTSSASEKDRIISKPEWGYRYEGIAYETLRSGGTELYRFFNRDKGYHFLTASSAEADFITGNPEWGYEYEGRTFTVSTRQTAATPTEVHRFYHEGKGIHFYSASEVEANNVISKSLGNGYTIDNAINNDNLLGNGWGYVYEGVAWYVADL